MDKKKTIIAIVLFVFLGLMVFTFANPTDEDTNSLQNSENGNTTTTTTTTAIDDNNTNSNRNNNVVNNTETVDYTTIRDLIASLREQVETATNIDMMALAKQYNTENEIEVKVGEIADETVLSELTKALEEIYKVLKDEKIPEINVEDGALLKEVIKLSVTDDNEVTIKLNGKEIDKDTEIADGVYELEVIDKAFNTTGIIKFTVDTVLPTGEVSYDETEKTKNDVLVTITTLESVTMPEGWTKVDDTTYTKKYTENKIETIKFTDVVGNEGSVEVKIENIDKLPAELSYKVFGSQVRIYSNEEIKIKNFNRKEDKNGNVDWRKTLDAGKNYTITAEDKAGNVTTIVVDRILPTATYELSTDKPTNQNVIVTLTTSEEILLPSDWTKVDDTTYTKVYTENKVELVTFKDVVGNKGSINIIVSNIDRVAPEVVELKLRKDGYHFDLTANEEIIINNGRWYRKNGKTWVGNYKTGKMETVSIFDLAGNETIVTIDNKKPVVAVTYSTVDPTNQPVEVTIMAVEEDIRDIAGWTKESNRVFKKIYTDNVYNEIVTVHDLIGNKGEAIINIENIDKVIPTAVVSYSTTAPTNQDVVVTLTTSEEVVLPNEWTKVNATTYTKVYTENKIETIDFTDLVGNVGTADIKIENIDIVLPEVREVRIENYFNAIGNKNYAKETDNIAIIINTTELLAEDPTVVIGNKEIKVPVQEPQFNKYVVYVPLTSDLGLSENEKIEITIKGLKDLAGNNGTEVTTTGSGDYYVIYDSVKPTMNSVVFKNISNPEHPEYANVGDKIWVYFTASERLGVEPTIKINGEDTKIVQYENGDNWNQPWEKFVAEYIVTNSTPEENITFEITNVIDKAGNTFDTVVTEADVTNSILVDITAPELYVTSLDKLDPQIYGGDKNPYTYGVILNGENIRPGEGTLTTENTYTHWFGIGYMSNGYYTVEAKDYAGNVTTKSFRLGLGLTSASSASNYIDTAANTIYNFNSFAIKFDRDIVIKPAEINNKSYMIEMEYSIDGGNTYTKSSYMLYNWADTLVKDDTDPNGIIKYSGTEEFTISAGSTIKWSGTNVGTRWTDIYNAIKATEGTDNKVYVRTIFTVIQPAYTQSFTLPAVEYSQGGRVTSPNGTATF